MLVLQTDCLELRGLKNETSKKGNVYYILFCEGIDGEPYKFFCKDASFFPQGLKKGDSIVLTLVYNSFKDLEVRAISKVEVEQ